MAEEKIDLYPNQFKASLSAVMCSKLGLTTVGNNDLTLGMDLLECMADGGADFTNTFRHLANTIDIDQNDNSDVREQFSNPVAFDQWYVRWLARLDAEKCPQDAIATIMREVNPAVIPRNHLVEAAIRSAEDNDDFTSFNNLLDEVVQPFKSRQPGSYFVRPASPNEVVHHTFCGT